MAGQGALLFCARIRSASRYRAGRANSIEADHSVGKHRTLAWDIAHWRRKDAGSPSRSRK